MEFVKFLLPVIEADKWVSPKTGEVHPFGWTDKAIYSLFRSRHNYFMKNFGRHDDKQSEISVILNISREKVNRFMSLLTKEGVLESTKKGNFQNNYIKLNDFCVINSRGESVKVLGYDD